VASSIDPDRPGKTILPRCEPAGLADCLIALLEMASRPRPSLFYQRIYSHDTPFAFLPRRAQREALIAI
jgi:hypothetical protein